MDTPGFIHLEFLRKTVLQLPGVTEKLLFGEPAFSVNKKLFAVLKSDGQTLAINTAERDVWMQADPHTFYITPHFQNYDYMLIRLERVDPDDLVNLLIKAWRKRATKKLIQQYEENA